MTKLEREKYIIDCYLTGESAKRISENCDIGPTQICRILKRNGIKVEAGGARRRRRHINEDLNHNFFEDVNREDAMYYLGFIYADGNIHEKQLSTGYISKRLTIEIHKKDKEVLENFKINNKINENEKKNSVYTTIYSDKIIEDLKILGVTQNKTKTCKFPTNIPKDLINHFIRGYFDGDGGFSIHRGSKNYYGLKAYFAGTESFLSEVQKHLPCLSTVRDTKKGIHELIVSTKREEMVKFVSFLYKDSTIFLTRKRQKAYLDFNHIQHLL